MRTLISTLAASAAIFAVCVEAQAQERPQPVPRLTRQAMSHSWYVHQQQLWHQEVQAHPADANAWYNYYAATRYAGFGDTTSQQKIWDAQQQLIAEMGKQVPNSFEYHYVRYWGGGNDPQYFPDLQKALEIKPDYAQISDSFICYYELAGDESKVAEFSRKWYETKEMSPGLLNYNYNVLMSLDKDAILFTAGDNDTYPIWILQYARGIRPDVTVINMGLIAADSYRAEMMKRHEIKGDSTLLGEANLSANGWEKSLAQYAESVAKSNDKRPVYFALSASPEQFTSIKDDLYTVGLASRYSPKRFDNVAVLKKNWEKFHLDYLGGDFYSEYYQFNQSGLPLMNMNYLSPAMLLFEHYALAGDYPKAEQYKQLSQQISEKAGQLDEINAYVAQIEEKIPGHDKVATANVKEEANEYSKAISVYPNPATNAVSVNTPPGDALVQIIDMAGTTHAQVEAKGGSVTTIPVQEIPNGEYLVRVSSLKGGSTKKIVIRH